MKMMYTQKNYFRTLYLHLTEREREKESVEE